MSVPSYEFGPPPPNRNCLKYLFINKTFPERLRSSNYTCMLSSLYTCYSGVGVGLFLLILIWSCAVCGLLLFSRVNSSLSTLLLILASIITVVLLAVPRRDAATETTSRQNSVADPVRCLFDPGKVFSGFRIPNPYFLELRDNFFGKKFFFENWLKFFSQHFKNLFTI